MKIYFLSSKIQQAALLGLLLTLPHAHLMAAEEPAAPENSSDSAPAVQVIEQPRIEPQPNQAMLMDLATSLPDKETQVIPLQAGDDNFNAFYREQSGAVIKGAILFFPEDLTHPDWPITLNTLRIGLTDHGWGTLSLSLPAPITAALPKRTLPSLKIIHSKKEPAEPGATPSESTEPPATSSEQPANSDKANSATTEESTTPLTSDRLDIIMKRGVSAVQWLQQKGYTRIVIAGSGSGATWATAFIKNLPEDSNIKLLILDAEQSKDISAPNYLELLKEIKQTTIDIYSQSPSNSAIDVSSDASIRLKNARRNKLNNYHQSRLPAPSSKESSQAWLLRFTRGMLETYIAKAEKDKIVIPSKPSTPTETPPGAAPSAPTNQAKPI
jgi:hypothetical protein